MAEEQVENIGTPVKTKLSLSEALKKISEVSFDFQLVGQEDTSPDKVTGLTQKVLILKLFDAIPYVRGSQKVDMGDGSVRTLEKSNVDEIKVLESEIQGNNDFDMIIEGDEITGTYKGSGLVLDISKVNYEVWLKKVSFASASKAYRNNNNQTKLNAVRARFVNPATIN